MLAAALRAAPAGAALIKQNRVKSLGIEQPTVIGLAAAAGSAMQIDRRDAIGAADGFDRKSHDHHRPAAVPKSAARTDRSVCCWLCPRRRQAPWSPPVSSVPPAKLR